MGKKFHDKPLADFDGTLLELINSITDEESFWELVESITDEKAFWELVKSIDSNDDFGNFVSLKKKPLR